LSGSVFAIKQFLFHADSAAIDIKNKQFSDKNPLAQNLNSVIQHIHNRKRYEEHGEKEGICGGGVDVRQ